MKITRDEAGEKKALQQIKDYLAKKPRSDKGWHVSDLLYPRQTYWRKVKPLPVTDDQALYFTAGHAHHGILEALLGPRVEGNPKDLAYAAGIIDGEGCITLTSPTAGRQAQVVVGSTTKAFLLWLQQRFKGSISKNKAAIGNHKEVYQWAVLGNDARAFVSSIRPYLVLKKEQASKWLSYWEGDTSGKKGSLVPIEKSRREKLFKELQALHGKDSTPDTIGSRSDAGEFEKHGILFSPDLRFYDGPLEIKTSRAMYIKADREDPAEVYEGYLKQLASYNALMNAPQGKLLVLFLNAVKDGLDKWKKKPQLRLYKVAFSTEERKKITGWLLKRAKELTAAVKKKKPGELPLCPAWMCKNDCPYYKTQCKPWLKDSARKGLQDGKK